MLKASAVVPLVLGLLESLFLLLAREQIREDSLSEIWMGLKCLFLFDTHETLRLHLGPHHFGH